MTGEGVGLMAKNRLVIKESQAREPRRSPRRTGNPDKEVQHEGVDSEEPTEFGLSHTGTVIRLGICDSNNAMEQPSPCLSDYESEGYLERRQSNSGQALPKKGICQIAKPIQMESRRVMQPRVLKKKL